MAFLCETIDRRVIPNWRSFQDTISNGELDYPKQTSALVFNLDEYVNEWKENHSLIYASELVNAAVANDVWDNNEAKNAAEFIVKNEGKITVSLRKIASSLLNYDKEKNIVKSESDEVVINIKDIYPQIGFLKSLIRKYPYNPINYVEIARYYLMIGQLIKAEKMINIAIALGSQNRFISRCSARFFVHIEDYDKAQYVLKLNRNIDSDPWLMASEISVNLLRNRSSSFIKKAMSLINSRNYSAFSLSELTSSLGTLEFVNGSQKKSRHYFNKSLISPNDNALAQAEWAQSNKLNLSFNRAVCEKVNMNFEANAMYEYQMENFNEALKYSIRWLNDMPYSKSPVFTGANIAYTFLHDYEKAANILLRGLEANPNEPAFLNNLAYTYALDNKLDKANAVIQRLKRFNNIDERTKICITATCGLIAFRENRIQEGRDLYLKAIKDSKDIMDDPTYNWGAMLNYIREEILVSNVKLSEVDSILSQIKERPQDKGIKALKHDVLSLLDSRSINPIK